MQPLPMLIKLSLSDYEAGGDRGPGGKYYYPDNAEWDLKRCEKLRINLDNIDIILNKLQEKDTKTKVNPLAFFQPGEETLTPANTKQFSSK